MIFNNYRKTVSESHISLILRYIPETSKEFPSQKLH